MDPKRAAEDHEGDDGGGSECEPTGVGTDVSRLHAAGEGAEAANAGCGTRGKAADDEEVEAGEQKARGRQQRLDQEGVVDLIDVELVLDQGVDGLEAVGESSRAAGVLDVEEPGDEEAEASGGKRDGGEGELERVADRSGAR